MYTASTIRTRRRRLSQRINGPADVEQLVRPLLNGNDREMFYNISLSTKHDVLAIELVSVGSLSASLVHPREVFRPAILHCAAAIVVVHNHPSGDADPSKEDVEFTRRLVASGRILGIRVLDHIILGDGVALSLEAEGRM